MCSDCDTCDKCGSRGQLSVGHTCVLPKPIGTCRYVSSGWIGECGVLTTGEEIFCVKHGGKVSEKETCYKCGYEYYGKAMMGHLQECKGQLATQSGWESRAAFPSPDDVIKDYQSIMAPKLNELRRQVVERLKKVYTGGNPMVHTTKTNEEYDLMLIIKKEAEKAGWYVKDWNDMREISEHYFSFQRKIIIREGL